MGSSRHVLVAILVPLSSCEGPPSLYKAPEDAPRSDAFLPDTLSCSTEQTPCRDGCVDLESDEENCGACGRSCFGQGCALGMCAPETVAADQAMPIYIVLDDTHVYWTNLDGGNVLRRKKSGGAIEVLVEGLVRPWSLALDGEDLYVGTSQIGENITHLYRVPKGGGTAVEIASYDGTPHEMAVDSHAVYSTRGCAAGGIARVDKESFARTLVMEWPFCVYSLALGESDLYYGVLSMDPFDVDHVARIPKAGGMATRLADLTFPHDIMKRGDALYVASWTADVPSQISVVNVAGGASPLALTAPGTSHVAVDADGVVWTNFYGSAAVTELRAGSTAPLPLALGGGAVPLAIDEMHAYYGIRGEEGLANGGIYRVARLRSVPPP